MLHAPASAALGWVKTRIARSFARLRGCDDVQRKHGPGLIFFGIFEPKSHLGNSPLELAPTNTPAAARLALQYSYFH